MRAFPGAIPPYKGFLMLQMIFVDLPILVLLYFAAAWLIHRYLTREEAPASAPTSASAPASRPAAEVTAMRAEAEPLAPPGPRTEAKAAPAIVEPAVPVPAHREAATGLAGAVHATLGVHLPEESVLRRHGLTEALRQVNELHAETSDSVLRRHRGQLIKARMEACISDPAELLRLRAEHAAHELEQRQRPTSAAVMASKGPAGKPATVIAEIEPAATVATATVAVSSPGDESSAASGPPRLPEDSVLRRHFLQHLRARFEADLPPPTCSILKRHYEQLLEMELDAFG